MDREIVDAVSLVLKSASFGSNNSKFDGTAVDEIRSDKRTGIGGKQIRVRGRGQSQSFANPTRGIQSIKWRRIDEILNAVLIQTEKHDVDGTRARESLQVGGERDRLNRALGLGRITLPGVNGHAVEGAGRRRGDAGLNIGSAGIATGGNLSDRAATSRCGISGHLEHPVGRAGIGQDRGPGPANQRGQQQWQQYPECFKESKVGGTSLAGDYLVFDEWRVVHKFYSVFGK